MKPSTRLLIVLFVLALSACATLDGPPDERDPFERYNRSVHAFNENVDRAILQPLARGYQAATPRPVNRSISNFFSNIGDVWVMINNLLQGKPRHALSDMQRIVWNSTAGIGGLFDVASHMDLPKHNEDFGQTLGVWGVGPGPYMVLPLLGPSTLRDTSGRVVQWSHDTLYHVVDDRRTWAYLSALNLIDQRAALLHTTRLIDSASIDSYAFMRDGYLQRREYLIHDGNPPQEAFDPFADDDLPLP